MFRQSQSTYTTTRSGNSARHLLTSSHKALNQHFQQLSLDFPVPAGPHTITHLYTAEQQLALWSVGLLHPRTMPW
ncbi:hypothetical protein DPMN_005735 [Dreissena polymorpha]|uniref:Uncharacterized protein n=1 Tax=Dreissena polymorpha TaxID=45954 RepID=A0A9D4MQT5_DREPO|nr:hypothetical protein DPMN_005735 [Dreissena polymorpha]